MNLEIALGIVLLVIIAAVVLWPAIGAWFKRVKGTKGAQGALADIDKVEVLLDAKLAPLFAKHTNPAPAASSAATASSSVGTQSAPVSQGVVSATPPAASEPAAAPSAGGGTPIAATPAVSQSDQVAGAHAALDATIHAHQDGIAKAQAAKDALTAAQSALADAAAAAQVAAKT